MLLGASIRGTTLPVLLGAVAEWLRSGLQSRVHRFDSGRRLWQRARRSPRAGADRVAGTAAEPHLPFAFALALVLR